MEQLIKKVKLLSIFLLVLSFMGCEDNDAVLPEVVAGFTYTLNSNTGTIEFINISENANNYMWNFGDGNTSTEINPIKTYETGEYTVTLKATNVSGASATFEDTVYINIPIPVRLPINFDGENVLYTSAQLFNGVSFEVVENPDPSGTNTVASNVGAITNSGAAFEGFFYDLDVPLDLSTDRSIKINFWSQTPLDILIKLEEGTSAATEVVVSHGGTGWEEMFFTFSSSASYNRFTMFVDGPGTTAGTFYIDDIQQVETQPDPCAAETAESMSAADFNMNLQTDQTANVVEDGADFEWIDNPDFDNAVNTSCKVGKITKLGNNPWDNNQILLDAKLDFNANAGFKIKVWSARANTEVRIKLEEQANAGNSIEQFLTTSVTSGWEELTFDFAPGDSDKFDKIVIFFDLNANNTDTYYFDDLMLYGTGAPSCTTTTLELPIDFDCDGIDYESKRVAGDIGFSIIDNPQVNGINAVATKVGEIVNIGNNWENLNFILDTPIDFTSDKSIKLKLYSTQSLPIKLKVEGGGTPVENDQNHGGTGWEELTFTLETSESFSNIIIFIDGPGNAVGTFYIDDIEQVNSGSGTGTSGAYLYSTEGTVDIITVWTDWGTGTAQDGVYDQDATYNPCIKLSGGSWGALVAFTEIPAGKLSEYGNLELKIKSDESTFKVKVPEVEKEFNIADGTPLEGGWVQMSIPLSTFGAAAVDAALEFAIWGSGGTTLYLTDIMLSGEGSNGGGTSGDCPAAPAGDLISNGDFEAGESCWQLIDNGGSVTISSTVSSGTGTKSAQIQTAPTKNPGVKQERFAAGTALPNTEYTVTFDIKADASTPLVDGAVFQAFVFSEGTDGGTTGAVQHVLVQGLGSVSTSWETKTYMFTSGAAADNVAGGFSFLAELVCGGAGTCDGIINIDNVSITLK